MCMERRKRSRRRRGKIRKQMPPTFHPSLTFRSAPLALKSHCFERQACLGLDAIKRKPTGGKLEGQNVQVYKL